MKLGTIFLHAGLILCISGIAKADDRNCPVLPAIDSKTLQDLARAPHPDRGLLWQVTKNGRSAYLYGTVHVAKLSWDYPGPSIREALDRSQFLAVEIDNTRPALQGEIDAARRTAMSAASSVPKDATLRARLDRLLQAACLSDEMPAGATFSAKITSLIMGAARDQGLFPDLAIDAAMIGYMRNFGKPVIELESAVAQARALTFDNAFAAQDLDDLESGGTRRELIELTSAWSDGDLATLERMVASDKARNARLLDDRNESLARRIDEVYATRERVFVAIGVLHMVGDGNVAERLRDMGYTVRRLVPAQAS